MKLTTILVLLSCMLGESLHVIASPLPLPQGSSSKSALDPESESSSHPSKRSDLPLIAALADPSILAAFPGLPSSPGASNINDGPTLGSITSNPNRLRLRGSSSLDAAVGAGTDAAPVEAAAAVDDSPAAAADDAPATEA